MNKITERAVLQAMEQNKAAAQRGGAEFDEIVNSIYQNELLIEIGLKYYHRAIHLLKLFAPDIYDDEGYLAPHAYEVEIRISEIVWRAMDSFVAQNNEEYRLDDYREYVDLRANPQMLLF